MRTARSARVPELPWTPQPQPRPPSPEGTPRPRQDRSPVSRRTDAFSLPPWLAHTLRAQRGPVPWSAVTRGALAAGPLLMVAVLVGHTSLGVLAALGAMLAGINDRPGSRMGLGQAARRTRARGSRGAADRDVHRGTCRGCRADASLHRDRAGRRMGFIAIGPVASGAGTQLLVASAIGAGMPCPNRDGNAPSRSSPGPPGWSCCGWRCPRPARSPVTTGSTASGTP